jgi:hypothetical protein
MTTDDHPRAPLEVRKHARGVARNPDFIRKEPEGPGCLILILTQACMDFPHNIKLEK